MIGSSNSNSSMSFLLTIIPKCLIFDVEFVAATITRSISSGNVISPEYTLSTGDVSATAANPGSVVRKSIPHENKEVARISSATGSFSGRT